MDHEAAEVERITESCSEALERFIKHQQALIQEHFDLIRFVLNNEIAVATFTQPEGEHFRNGPARAECPECGETVFCFADTMPYINTCSFCGDMYYAIMDEELEIEFTSDLCALDLNEEAS